MSKIAKKPLSFSLADAPAPAPAAPASAPEPAQVKQSKAKAATKGKTELRQIGVRLPVSDLRRLKLKAAQDERTIQELIGEAVARLLAGKQ